MFMFCLDLDEIDQAASELALFGHNRARLYNFRESDHICEPGQTLKESIFRYVRTQDPGLDVRKIILLTNVRTMGYIFNPVSFYYCYDQAGDPQCVVVEIGNTFGERKFFFISPAKKTAGRFKDEHVKYYYISPFTNLDDSLEFRLGLPGSKLFIGVDTIEEGNRVIFASMWGERKELTNANLWKYSFMVPLVTWKVIWLIHWHALLLFLKGVPFQKKEDNPHMQKGVWCAHAKK